MFMKPSTFSRTIYLGLISLTSRTYSPKSRFLGSSANLFPALEKPWQLGPPITKSISGIVWLRKISNWPIFCRINSPFKSLTSALSNRCFCLESILVAHGDAYRSSAPFRLCQSWTGSGNLLKSTPQSILQLRLIVLIKKSATRQLLRVYNRDSWPKQVF